MYTEVWERAMDRVKVKEGGSPQHRAAFANSVAYLVTGMSGGAGGPSLREHLVSWSLGRVRQVIGPAGGQPITMIEPGELPLPGNWDFEAACRHAMPLVFGPPQQHVTALLQIAAAEQCFDDDPGDLAFVARKK